VLNLNVKLTVSTTGIAIVVIGTNQVFLLSMAFQASARD